MLFQSIVQNILDWLKSIVTKDSFIKFESVYCPEDSAIEYPETDISSMFWHNVLKQLTKILRGTNLVFNVSTSQNTIETIGFDPDTGQRRLSGSHMCDVAGNYQLV